MSFVSFESETMRVLCIILKIVIWSYYHWSFISRLKHNPVILQGSQILKLCSSCNYGINIVLSNLVAASDFTISVLPEVYNIDPPTLWACKILWKVSVFFLKPFNYSEMTGTMTIVDPQPHQDVLFLNNKCCNQHHSCQVIPCPDVLNQLHNSIGGPHKTLYCSAPPHSNHQHELPWFCNIV